MYPVSLNGTTPSLVSGGIILASVLPKDPSNTGDYVYTYVPLQFSSGTCGIGYYLYSKLENKNSDTYTNVDYQTNPLASGLSVCSGGSFPSSGFGQYTYDVSSPK